MDGASGEEERGEEIFEAVDAAASLKSGARKSSGFSTSEIRKVERLTKNKMQIFTFFLSNQSVMGKTNSSNLAGESCSACMRSWNSGKII